MKHPDIKLTTDGLGNPYVHGEEGVAKGSFFVLETYGEEKPEEVCLNAPVQEEKVEESGYELLSEQDLEEEFSVKKKDNNQKNENKKEEEEKESQSEEE